MLSYFGSHFYFRCWYFASSWKPRPITLKMDPMFVVTTPVPLLSVQSNHQDEGSLYIDVNV